MATIYVDPNEVHQDFVDGYRDGHDDENLAPGLNRSERYKHSFRVARAEKTGNYLGLAEIKKSLAAAELADAGA
jgi:hypothetical protein